MIERKMINAEASLKLVKEIAKNVRKEIFLDEGKVVYNLHDKILFLLAHKNDGTFNGKTCLAKVICLFDALVLEKKDFIVIDYFGPEDANFPRAIAFLSAGKLLHIQRLGLEEHVLLTWRGYDHFRRMRKRRSPALMSFIQELIELRKIDESLIDTTYQMLFNTKWGERRIPLSAFLRGDEVIYNSLAYNLYRYQPTGGGEPSGMYRSDVLRVDLDDIILPSVSGGGLDGEDMKDGQSLAFPYLEAANFFIMTIGKMPSLRDIAHASFSRLRYYERLAEDLTLKERERKENVVKRDAIMKVCSKHLEILCERGILEEKREKEREIYVPTARTYKFNGLTYSLLSRKEALNYMDKMKKYVESYRKVLRGATVWTQIDLLANSF